MSSLQWYAGRAAAMSPREMLWRTGRVAATLTKRDGLRERPDTAILTGSTPDWEASFVRFRTDAAFRPVLLDGDRAAEIANARPDEVRLLIAEADDVLAGRRAFFGYPIVSVGTAVDWNHDPITDHHWPTSSGTRIDHRVASSDPKWIWELNRLQHLPMLASAWLFTNDQRYAETALDLLDSWVAQNPVGTGIAWRGAFEPGIRAISVAIALQGLRTSPAMTAARYRRAARMLDASARYCWHARSRFSSANNHLVGELAGLVTVHLLLPELTTPAALYERALHALGAEAERLILPDGAGAEQSVSYQMFAAELLATVAVLVELSGNRVPSTLCSALDRGARYLASLVGAGDPDPRYGDDDDSFALRLGPERKRTVRQHLGIVAAITGNEDAARCGEKTLTAAWIAAALGPRGGEVGSGGGSADVEASTYATDGGFVVLRSDRRRLTVDVGPLGYLSTAAHGHADALAVTLGADGREIVVDPGTASFYGCPAWRDVHRGTRVHATVCVDGADQSAIGGPFLWSHHARTTVHAVDLERGIVDAEHDGYRRLDDPVAHRRWVIDRPGDSTIAVVDLIRGQSTHDVAVSWPLHPRLDATPTTHGHLITDEDVPVLELCYAATMSITTEQVRADSETHLGWWSDRLESRTPAWLVGVRCRGIVPVAVLSVLHVGDDGVIDDPEIDGDDATLVASWTERGVRRSVTIDTTRPGAVVIRSHSFDARVVRES